MGIIIVGFIGIYGIILVNEGTTTPRQSDQLITDELLGAACSGGKSSQANIEYKEECVEWLRESLTEPTDYTSSYMGKVVPTLDDFRNTLNESPDIETIFFKFGEPHDDIGSGIHIYVYELNDSTQIWIGYADHILYVQHVDSDGNILEQLL